MNTQEKGIYIWLIQWLIAEIYILQRKSVMTV